MKTPGPGKILFIHIVLGSYNPNNSVMQRSVPRFSMASKHLTHYDREGPGPGTYENKSTVVGVPSVRYFTFNKKKKDSIWHIELIFMRIIKLQVIIKK